MADATMSPGKGLVSSLTNVEALTLACGIEDASNGLIDRVIGGQPT